MTLFVLNIILHLVKPFFSLISYNKKVVFFSFSANYSKSRPLSKNFTGATYAQNVAPHPLS